MKNDKFEGIEIISVKDRIERIVNEHKTLMDSIDNRNVFCTSLELAEITGKRHDNVLADIEDVLVDISVIDVPKFQGTLNNQRFVQSEEVNDRNFRVSKGVYKSSQGKDVSCYYLDEVFYFCMLNKYNNFIRYNMALYYVKMKKLLGYTVEELIDLPKTKLPVVEISVWSALCLSGEARVYMNKQEDGSYKLNINRNPSETDKSNAQSNLDSFKDNPYFLGDQKDELDEMLKSLDLKKWIPYDLYIDLTANLGESYSNTRIVAKMTKKEHRHVVEDIRHILRDLNNGGISNDELVEHFIPTQYKDSYGREQPEYTLSQVGFITLLGRYYTEVNYRLAEYYVNTKHVIVDYERAIKTTKEDLLEALEKMGTVIINKEELIDKNNNLKGDVKNDK